MGESGKPVDPIPIPILNQHNQKVQKPDKQLIRIGSWNIRRGLVIREQEILNLIRQNNLGILFLVETDTLAINTEVDYKLLGFKTIIQNKKDNSTPTRIISLVNEKLSNEVTIRMDLTSTEFPSLWIELENNCGSNIICGGFYREWVPQGKKTIEAQVEAMCAFTYQIE
jgi:hypothetical protein